MKKFYALFFVVCFAAAAFAQNKKPVYLMVQIDRAYNAGVDKRFFRIDAEPDNPHAQSLYHLVNYKPKLRRANAAGFYFSHNRYGHCIV